MLKPFNQATPFTFPSNPKRKAFAYFNESSTVDARTGGAAPFTATAALGMLVPARSGLLLEDSKATEAFSFESTGASVNISGFEILEEGGSS